MTGSDTISSTEQRTTCLHTPLVAQGLSRPPNQPRPSMTPIFAAWQHTKERSLLIGDPIPYQTLHHPAASASGETTRPSNSQRPILTPSTPFPTGRRLYRCPQRRRQEVRTWPYTQLTERAGQFQRRLRRYPPNRGSQPPYRQQAETLLRKRGVKIPHTNDIARRLRDTVFRELRAENRTVIDFPTAGGTLYRVAAELGSGGRTSPARASHTPPPLRSHHSPAIHSAANGMSDSMRTHSPECTLSKANVSRRCVYHRV